MEFKTFAIRGSLIGVAVFGLLACSTPPPPRPQPPAPRSAPPPVIEPAPAPKPQPAVFIRPAPGTTLARFDGKRNKGIDIAGKAGDPIMAAADGKVVIVSSALRGYGTMVIVKHNDTFLTAYAHLQRSLVKENDSVRQGQTIAEMGKTGADRIKLHFEIRKDGVAVDPEPYLSGKLR